jgi:hypothetical protein
MTDLLDLIYQGGGDETPTRPKIKPGVTGSFKPVKTSAQDEMTRQAEADSRKLKPESDSGWGHHQLRSKAEGQTTRTRPWLLSRLGPDF